jgi:hypothetical protein
VEATKEALPIVLGTSDTSAASHTPGRSKLPSAVRNAAGLARRLLSMLVNVRPPRAETRDAEHPYAAVAGCVI